MNPVEIIARKRDGAELTAEEIGFFVRGITEGCIADYQASAWLMAVYLQGMTARETRDLTLAMRDSGAKIDLSDVKDGPALDKHSTGGVGDKTTLIVVPILAALGVRMLKMSGRGLGFSGGTVDKLESIPGFRTELSVAEAKAQVARIGAALIAQSKELAPADGILYALRDVTATVASIPLIASSIMSKKLAAGAGRIVLDVKAGRGSFMKTREQAEALARTLVTIGEGAGVPTSAVLTAMDEPLGRMVGNALEVREALSVLRNDPESEPLLRALCVELAGHGLLAVGKATTLEEGSAQAERALASGRAAAKFAEIVAAQGGPDRCAAILAALPQAPERIEVSSDREGVVAGLDAEAIGRLAMAMGAGREKKGGLIDPAVGIALRAKTGDRIAMGGFLATLHLKAEDVVRVEDFAAALRAAYRIVSPSEASPPPSSLILGSIP
ncbi:MAG TPA: thymidine phosphorylase [Chthonomonadaceae bacterium]|nr:thymidine phosphorylase [Chthonomonadaceae bacterium]